MSLTQQQIVDEILQRFANVWDDTGHTVIYPDRALTKEQTDLIAGTGGVELAPWARLTLRTASRNQRTLGGPGGRIYTTDGILFVEIYTPTGDGHQQAYELATIVRDAYEIVNDSSYHVWYRSINISEQGSEGLWSRLNITVEWEAQELK
jgi:hypothetical protein